MSASATEQSAVTMLAGTVEVVISGDTHTHTHTATVVRRDRRRRRRRHRDHGPGQLRRPARHGTTPHGPAAWAVERTGGYGAGLARYFADHGEAVIELDRPQRPARRHGAAPLKPRLNTSRPGSQEPGDDVRSAPKRRPSPFLMAPIVRRTSCWARDPGSARGTRRRGPAEPAPRARPAAHSQRRDAG